MTYNPDIFWYWYTYLHWLPFLHRLSFWAPAKNLYCKDTPFRSAWYSQDLVCDGLIHEKAPFRGKTGVYAVSPPESAISWRKMRQRKSGITRDKQICERDLMVCVYWFVVMSMCLPVCSKSYRLNSQCCRQFIRLHCRQHHVFVLV